MGNSKRQAEHELAPCLHYLVLVSFLDSFSTGSNLL